MIKPGAEPFFFPGGRTGCLLVHGFTGTPYEMRWLGEKLAGQGYSVLGVRLTGHSTRVEDMVHTRWQDWLACVEDGYHLLHGITDQVVLVGLSLGGILSLIFASGRFTPHCPVDGVVALAAPHHLPANPLLLSSLKPLSIFQAYRKKTPAAWYDPETEKTQVSYTLDPTRSFAELRDALVEMRAGLSQVRTPTLLIYSKQDCAVTPQECHAELILSALGTPVKELVWVENSNHNIAQDAQRQKAFAIAADFIEKEILNPG